MLQNTIVQPLTLEGMFEAGLSLRLEIALRAGREVI